MSGMQEVKALLRPNRLPHIYCPGCGDGTVAQMIAKAVLALKLERDEVTIVTGIGCFSRISNLFDFNSFQAVHGRAIPYATGYKAALPNMKVIVVVGDGDGVGIGGNHLIHAARRNVDLTVIMVNNENFGMTGGQYSPTTPNGARASTAPYLNPEFPINTCQLVEASGATYVARGTVYHSALTQKLIEKAIAHHGFSFVEIISQCPTGYGKRNGMADPVAMLMNQKENAIPVEKARMMAPEELAGKHIIGELLERRDRTEFVDACAEICLRCKEKENRG